MQRTDQLCSLQDGNIARIPCGTTNGILSDLSNLLLHNVGALPVVRENYNRLCLFRVYYLNHIADHEFHSVGIWGDRLVCAAISEQIRYDDTVAALSEILGDETPVRRG